MWVRQPLDSHSLCLPITRIRSEGQEKISTKACVASKNLNQNKYLLGNRTGQFIEEREKAGQQTTEQINAIMISMALVKEEHVSKINNEGGEGGRSSLLENLLYRRSPKWVRKKVLVWLK